MPLAVTGELSVACRLGRGPVRAGRAREQARKALPGRTVYVGLSLPLGPADGW